jgi:hypothetical protein
MESVRPLRDVFADLAGHDDAGSGASDPRTFLAGHEGLPDDLLVTAIGSYAGTAPAEIAEHLAPIVTPSSQTAPEGDHFAGVEASDGLNLLASAPVGSWDGEVALDHEDGATFEHPDDVDQFHDPATHFGDLGGLSNADSLDDDGFGHQTPPDHLDHLDHAGPLTAPEHGTTDDHGDGFADGEHQVDQIDQVDGHDLDLHFEDGHFEDGQFEDAQDPDEHLDPRHDLHSAESDPATGSDYHVEHHLGDDGSGAAEGLDHDGLDLGDFHG